MFRLVENNAKVDIRLPSELRSALEDARRRMSKKTGVKMKTSAVIRAILEQALKPKRRLAASERAA